MAGERYVHVRCTFRNGAFPTEYLVVIEIEPEEYKGFVPRQYVDVIDGQTAVVEGCILEEDDSVIRIRFPGSFFHDSVETSVLPLPKEWMNRNSFPAKLLDSTA